MLDNLVVNFRFFQALALDLYGHNYILIIVCCQAYVAARRVHYIRVLVLTGLGISPVSYALLYDPVLWPGAVFGYG